MGLGMASPYLVLGALPGLIRFLPKPGPWMETVQQLMAFLLLATVVYLFLTLSPGVFRADAGFPGRGVVWGLVGGADAALNGRTARRAAAWAAAAGGSAWWAGLLHPAAARAQDRLAALFARGPGQGPAGRQDRHGRFQRRLVPHLQVNLKFAVETEPVKAHRAERRGAHAGRLDRPSPMIKRSLNELGCDSIPQLVIYPGDRPDEKPKVLSDLIDPEPGARGPEGGRAIAID